MKDAFLKYWPVLLLWLTTINAPGAGLVNGDFEDPPLTRSIEEYDVAPTGFGWVITKGQVDVETSEYWQPAHGNQSLDMNGTMPASIYQDFTFNSSGTWFVKFAMSANPDLFTRGDSLGSGLRLMQVDFGIPGMVTNLGTFSADATPRTVSNMRWITMVTPALHVSTGIVYRLQFTSLSDGLGGPALDNVMVSRCEADPVGSLRVTEVEYCWESELESKYRVQYRSALTDQVWVDLLGTNVTGTGASICIPDRVLAGQAQRFYRVICFGRDEASATP